jgi:hypothetical protein
MITVIFATVLAASMAGQTAVGRVAGGAFPAGCAEEASPPDRRWR